jgi:hypothetical protein
MPKTMSYMPINPSACVYTNLRNIIMSECADVDDVQLVMLETMKVSMQELSLRNKLMSGRFRWAVSRLLQ